MTVSTASNHSIAYYPAAHPLSAPMRQEIKRKKANLNKTQPQITKFFRNVSQSQQPHQYHNGKPPDGISNNTTSRPQKRAVTVQCLMTMFLHKRASNLTSHPTISPQPSHESHV